MIWQKTKLFSVIFLEGFPRVKVLNLVSVYPALLNLLTFLLALLLPHEAWAPQEEDTGGHHHHQEGQDGSHHHSYQQGQPTDNCKLVVIRCWSHPSTSSLTT